MADTETTTPDTDEFPPVVVDEHGRPVNDTDSSVPSDFDEPAKGGLLDRLTDWINKITGKDSEPETLDEMIDRLAGFYTEILTADSEPQSPGDGRPDRWGSPDREVDNSTAAADTDDAPADPEARNPEQSSPRQNAADARQATAAPADTPAVPSPDSKEMAKLTKAAEKISNDVGIDAEVLMDKAKAVALARQGYGDTVATAEGTPAATMDTDAVHRQFSQADSSQKQVIEFVKQQVHQAALGNGLDIPDGDGRGPDDAMTLRQHNQGRFAVEFTDTETNQRVAYDIEPLLTDHGRAALDAAGNTGSEGSFDPEMIDVLVRTQGADADYEQPLFAYSIDEQLAHAASTDSSARPAEATEAASVEQEAAPGVEA